MLNIPFEFLVLGILGVVLVIGAGFSFPHWELEPFKSARANGVKPSPASLKAVLLLMIGGAFFVVFPSFGSLEFVAERVDLGTATAWGHLITVALGFNLCFGAVAAIGYHIYKAVQSGSFRFAFKPFFQRWGVAPGFFLGALSLFALGLEAAPLGFMVLVFVSWWVLVRFLLESGMRAAMSKAASQNREGASC